MKLNKFLLLSALTMMISSVAIAEEVTGTESGGGGDAVEVEGQLILRDLAEKGQLQNITNIVKFLDTNTKFRDVIHKIAKANPEFATRLVSELIETRIYTSPEPLNLLPYKQTTVYGSPAEVQLAIRIGQDIVLAPKFFESSDREYIMIHEALHGLLQDNKGPFHHQRVRNIVRYIYENLETLDAQDFKEYLRKNNYEASRTSYARIWSTELSDAFRCAYSDRSTLNKNIYKYEKITCPDNTGPDDYAVSVVIAYLRENFPGLQERYMANYTKINDFKLEEVNISPIEKKPSLFRKEYRENQIKSCKNVITRLGAYSEYKKLLEEKQSIIKEVHEKTDKLNEGYKYLIQRYFEYRDEYFSPERLADRLDYIDHSITAGKKYTSSCYAYYGKDL